jgi:hypothetical protein
MSDLIDTIIKTREIAEDIAIKSLDSVLGISETSLRDKIISKTANHQEIFPKGWYDPPASGVGILFDQAPFARLQFNSLRDPVSWPVATSNFQKESVGIVYFSIVDRETDMIGDIGLTIYNGNNPEIRNHIKKSYETILLVAKHAKVGMKFSELSNFAFDLLKNNYQMIGWMTTTNDPTLGANWGHTVPGSFEKDFIFGNSFEEIKNTITKKRIYINSVENFIIPETCAFTLEARLANSKNPNLPNVFFHFIVCFDNGKKTILENFDEIFKVVGMNYMHE